MKNKKSAPKKEQKPQVEAPVVEATVVENKKPIPQSSAAMKGMSQDSKVLMFATMHDRFGKDPEKQKTNPTIKHLNIVTDALCIDALITEACIKGTTFGQIVSKSDDIYCAMKELCATYQIDFDEKALPAPTKEQMEAAGVIGDPKDHVVVEISDKTISEETKNRVNKEQDMLKKYPPVEKPEDVTDDNVLKSSIIKLFADKKNPVNRMVNAINFYRGYLDAKKLDHSEMSDEDILNDIISLFGEYPPFQELGILGTYYTQLCDYKSVIPVFLITKKGAESETCSVKNMPDTLVMAIARAYAKWGAEFQKIRTTKDLESRTAQLEKANKDGNKKSAKECELFIERLNAKLNEINTCLDVLSNPSDEGIANLETDYATDGDSFEHSRAVRIVNGINSVYHKNEELKGYTADSVFAYAKQRAGIIVNLFRSPLEQLPDYSEAYLPELTKVEEEKTEEKPAEEKN